MADMPIIPPVVQMTVAMIVVDGMVVMVGNDDKMYENVLYVP